MLQVGICMYTVHIIGETTSCLTPTLTLQHSKSVNVFDLMRRGMTIATMHKQLDVYTTVRSSIQFNQKGHS
jgi:hypothetical protein